jgi:hypothetical protein
MTSRWVLFGAAMLMATTSVGCLARGGAAALSADDTEEDEDSIGSLPVAPAPQNNKSPGQMEVTWEDNGIPIRQLTGDGGPQEMKVPSSHPKKPAAFAPTPSAK